MGGSPVNLLAIYASRLRVRMLLKTMRFGQRMTNWAITSLEAEVARWNAKAGIAARSQSPDCWRDVPCDEVLP